MQMKTNMKTATDIATMQHKEQKLQATKDTLDVSGGRRRNHRIASVSSTVLYTNRVIVTLLMLPAGNDALALRALRRAGE
jgi:hypothetical protein